MKKFKRGTCIFWLGSFFAWSSLCSLSAQVAQIRVDVSKIENSISPYIYGSCIEDVNHEIYGGLYDQKIYGESFEEPVRALSSGNSASDEPAVSAHWDIVQTGGAEVVFFHDAETAFNGKYSQQIQKKNSLGSAGISNSSLNRWGISVKQGQKYQGRLYLRGDLPKGSVKVALQSEDGKREYAVQEIRSVSGQWEKYPLALCSNATDPKARLAIYMNEPGKLWVDQVVLTATGGEQFHGLPFRNDIGLAMQKQGLTFLRYGGTMVNAPEYRFKKMIGDPDRRPPYKGHWNPYSTNGFGIEDFLKFCEAAGFQASFAVNIEESPEDMADMIEYLNGPVSSVWGKKRAENGHPEPFAVKYVEIGNEEAIHADETEGYKHYIDRFCLLYDAIKSKDPSVVLINSAWWRPDSPNMEMVFKALNGKSDYWDYHPWADELATGIHVEKELKQMQALFLKWDPNTQMKCAVFEENGNTHTMQRALGHVTLQNAVRRCGDFVLTTCAANALQPYLQNDNGWDQGQIFFTPVQVWGMPPYYAQQMAADNHLPLRVSSSATEGLDVTATRDEEGNAVVLHIANVKDTSVSACIEMDQFVKESQVEVTTLSGGLKAINTPEQPQRVIPVKKRMQQEELSSLHLPAHSYTIIKYMKEK